MLAKLYSYFSTSKCAYPKNLLFYLTSSCSSKDIPMVKTIKTRCNDMAWYILECPFFRTEEGRCINVNDCHMMGEMPRQEVNVLKEYLSRKEIYI